jgi:hypothetical protein
MLFSYSKSNKASQLGCFRNLLCASQVTMLQQPRGGTDDSFCYTQNPFAQNADGAIVDTARLCSAGRSGAICRKWDEVSVGRCFGQVRFWEIHLREE